MPLSKNINTYIDVVQVLTAARERGGIVTYELASKGAAMNWRMRAYYYRTLLTRAAVRRAGDIRGFVPTTQWDDMLLEPDGNKVHISFGRVAGVLTDEKGKQFQPAPPSGDPGAAEAILAQVPMQPAPPVPRSPQALDDDLLAQARLLAEQKGAK